MEFEIELMLSYQNERIFECSFVPKKVRSLLFEYSFQPYLQQQVQFDGRDFTGCGSELQMYKCILCFMVVSLRETTPYLLKAIPLTKNNHKIVQNGILNCISILSG